MSTTNSTTQTGNRRPISRRVGVVILSALGLVVIAYFITVFFGSVHGNEFAPDTFTRRDFSYYQLPLIQIQVSPVRRVVREHDLCQHLIDNGIISTTNTASRWDLVTAVRGTRELRDGDASILCRYLDARDSERTLYWLNWTKNHPKLAKVLWPKVAQAARIELYSVIPDMFRAAWTVKNATDLQRDLNVILKSEQQDVDQIPAERPPGGDGDSSISQSKA